MLVGEDRQVCGNIVFVFNTYLPTTPPSAGGAVDIVSGPRMTVLGLRCPIRMMMTTMMMMMMVII